MATPLNNDRTTFSISFSTHAVKCITITALGLVTIGAVIAATAATSTFAIIMFSALAVIACAGSLAAIPAAFSNDSNTVIKFFEKCQENFGAAIATVVQIVSQVMIQALAQRAANWISGSQKIEVTHKYRD